MSESCWYNVKFLRNVNKSQPVVTEECETSIHHRNHHDSSQPCLCSFPMNAEKKLRQIRLLFEGLKTGKRRSSSILISNMQSALETHMMASAGSGKILAKFPSVQQLKGGKSPLLSWDPLYRKHYIKERIFPTLLPQICSIMSLRF